MGVENNWTFINFCQILKSKILFYNNGNENCYAQKSPGNYEFACTDLCACLTGFIVTLHA